MPPSFGSGDYEEEEIEYVLFRGALNGEDANLAANARLAEAGLVPVKDIITDALLRRADWLRIDPKGNVSVISFSVDGVWYPGGRLPKQRALAVTQMMKLLAGLNTRQRKKSQQGGIKAELSGKNYELMVDSTPVAGGAERLSIELIDPSKSIETPEDVGIPPNMKQRIRELSAKKNGVILVCGPPKSGTTTSLVGTVLCIDSFLYTIYNVADFDRHELAYVADFEMLPEDDLETSIDRMIRVEADSIIMKPLSDAEMVKTIFKMQKKVSIFAEFAARDVAHGIVQVGRWLEDPELLATGLSAIITQKMIRLLCNDCKMAYRPNPKMAARVGFPPETKALYRPPDMPVDEEDEEDFESCDTCGDIGYYGRTSLFEFIEITEGLREVIAADSGLEVIKKEIKRGDMQTLQKEGLRLVSEGKTSLEELQRIFKAK